MAGCECALSVSSWETTLSGLSSLSDATRCGLEGLLMAAARRGPLASGRREETPADDRWTYTCDRTRLSVPLRWVSQDCGDEAYVLLSMINDELSIIILGGYLGGFPRRGITPAAWRSG